MDERIKELEKELALIKERNIRVQADKGWETSKTRVFAIVLVTYVFAASALYFIGVVNYLQSALIPVLGYFLSTQSLPVIKKWWIKRNY